MHTSKEQKENRTKREQNKSRTERKENGVFDQTFKFKPEQLFAFPMVSKLTNGHKN